MDQAAPAPSIDSVFAGASFTVRGIYERLIDAMRVFGPMAEEPEEGGVAITVQSRVFADALPHGDKLLLDIRSDRVIANGRLRRIERGDDGRFRNELLLASVNDVDDELLAWLGRAYADALGPPAG